ncbi:hypothetical protein C8Q70DRAFT_427785 [Cubamyces menziesii]|nr:hypothetical protein C8Q70DRAFT_427785 [Cubamyces menziesii]
MDRSRAYGRLMWTGEGERAVGAGGEARDLRARARPGRRRGWPRGWRRGRGGSGRTALWMEVFWEGRGKGRSGWEMGGSKGEGLGERVRRELEARGGGTGGLSIGPRERAWAGLRVPTGCSDQGHSAAALGSPTPAHARFLSDRTNPPAFLVDLNNPQSQSTLPFPLQPPLLPGPGLYSSSALGGNLPAFLSPATSQRSTAHVFFVLPTHPMCESSKHPNRISLRSQETVTAALRSDRHRRRGIVSIPDPARTIPITKLKACKYSVSTGVPAGRDHRHHDGSLPGGKNVEVEWHPAIG